MIGFDLNELVAEATGRKHSLFAQDVAANSEELRKRINGTAALVVGGAGTIGHSFIKQLLAYGPKKVVVLDTNENGLTELVRDCRSTPGLRVPSDFITYPVNFSDPIAHEILLAHGPFQVVANFAAHKHVRSEKDIFSVSALLANNVFRAREFINKLIANPPDYFFCVSTDKAVSPANIMGASKQLMEQLVLSMAPGLPSTTARFANVAFSNGSLLDGFLERLMRRQPLSAPNDVRRYFVSPAESGQICLLACMLGQPGEIYFPKFDPNRDLQRFSDIAERVLAKLNLAPIYCDSEEQARALSAELRSESREYPVYFFCSDTSGEKAFEEFYNDGQDVDLQRYVALGVIPQQDQLEQENVEHFINSLQDYLRAPGSTKEGIVKLLSSHLAGFEHQETGKNLDQRM